MKRLGLAISIMLVSTLSGTAYAESDVTSGEASYNSNCAGCHRVAATIAADINRETGEEAAAELDAFLSGHFAPDAETRKTIITYLQSLDGE